MGNTIGLKSNLISAQTINDVIKFAIVRNRVKDFIPYDSPLWQSIARHIKTRDRNKCRHCGSTKHLAVHHIIALKHGGTNLPENLKTLCDYCHKSRHPELRKYKYGYSENDK